MILNQLTAAIKEGFQVRIERVDGPAVNCLRAYDVGVKIESVRAPVWIAKHEEPKLIEAGWDLWFDPGIVVIHDFEGWSMEADLRRNAGHGTIITRLSDSSLPYAALVRMGRVSIPFVISGKIIDSWRDCLRCGQSYGVSPVSLPAAMLLSIGIHSMEIPGMLRAYNGAGLKRSLFR